MAAKPTPSPLLTRDEVKAELLREIDKDTVTVVSARYDISISQLSDIKHGRAEMSRRVFKQYRYKLIERFQKVERNEKL